MDSEKGIREDYHAAEHAMADQGPEHRRGSIYTVTRPGRGTAVGQLTIPQALQQGCPTLLQETCRLAGHSCSPNLTYLIRIIRLFSSISVLELA